MDEGDSLLEELVVEEVEPSPFVDIQPAASGYMSEERFGRVVRGMSQSDVRAALGPVESRNVYEFDHGHIVAWAYPRVEPGYAAVVFFSDRQQKDGNYMVYMTHFAVVTADHP